MKKSILIGLCMILILITGCNNKKIDRTCKVIEKDDEFDIVLYGAYARIDNRSCCVIPKIDNFGKEITIINAFIYCSIERTSGNITIK